MDREAQKEAAARRALAFVEPGMRLGLGTGSTAEKFVALLAEAVRGGLEITAVPTSERTRAQAERLGIPLTTLDDVITLDLVVDGADEVDDALRLIKGGGGALLYEKIVAAAAARMVVIADASKRVSRLGRFPLPVEVVPFGHRATCRLIGQAARAVGCRGEIALRVGDTGAPFRSDGGNLIYDCSFGRIDDPQALATALSAVPGVIEHGLFIGMASLAVIAGAEGVDILEPQ